MLQESISGLRVVALACLTAATAGPVGCAIGEGDSSRSSTSISRATPSAERGAATGGGSPARTRIGSARGSVIVYWSESPWPSIWAIRPDGSHRHRILHNRQNAKRPVLSPDRRLIAFDGTPPGQPPLTNFDIQLVRADGVGPRTLTHGSTWDVDAQWSPDGRLLSFSRSPPHPTDATDADVWIVRRDGTGLRRLVRGFSARWSPDGTELVYQAPSKDGAGDLHIIGRDGRDDRSLLATPALETPAGWSPDGHKILFTRSPGPDEFEVFRLNADGSDVRHLAHGIAGSWSPDGSQIVYTSGFEAPLFLMNSDGSHKRKVASLGAADPSWR